MEIYVEELIEKSKPSDLKEYNNKNLFSRHLFVNSTLKDDKCISLQFDNSFVIRFPASFFNFEGRTLEVNFDAYEKRVICFAFVKEDTIDNFPESEVTIHKHIYGSSDIQFNDKELALLSSRCRLWLDSAKKLEDSFMWQ